MILDKQQIAYQHELERRLNINNDNTNINNNAIVGSGSSPTTPVEIIKADTDGAYTARKPRGGSVSFSTSSSNDGRIMHVLPDPVMKYGKLPPRTEYTSKTFDTTLSSSIQSRWIVTDAGKSLGKQQQLMTTTTTGDGGECVSPSSSSQSSSSTITPTTAHVHGDGHKPTNKSNIDDVQHQRHGHMVRMSEHKHHVSAGDGDEDDDDDDDIHLPAGQHLLIDIENVDSAFLNDEERLAVAMLELVNECGLTLLSYHCHKLKPMGVSCAGVLLESHVSFHTWPKEGVITLDLYTCGPKSIIPIVPTVERLFSIPKQSVDVDDVMSQPNMVWAHKYRGFSDEMTRDDIVDLSDLQTFPLGTMTDYKKEVCAYCCI
jgi:S-adenosylmethionine decarboxylase proenzyme